MIFQKAGSKGCFRLLFCKVSPKKLPDLVSYAKGSFCGRKYTDEYTVSSLLEGKINNNTNIHLDLQQIGCYCIRPTASYNNSQYCRRSR